LRHVAASSSLRVNRLEGNDRHRSFLDSFDHFRLARVGNAQIAMNNGRYKNQKVAVLGAGLSGSAAALLLASEGARVTVLDSASEDNLLKSTLDNLRAHGVHVVCGSEAERDSSAYDWMVLSPGIDPVSPLARNFSSSGIETIS